MSDFILELLSEEIPSRMQKQASEYLHREFKQQTEDAGLEFGQIQSFYSMRRLTLIVTNMKSQTCLLYTSPSPRDATLSRMPSSA